MNGPKWAEMGQNVYNISKPFSNCFQKIKLVTYFGLNSKFMLLEVAEVIKKVIGLVLKNNIIEKENISSLMNHKYSKKRTLALQRFLCFNV